MALSTSAEFKSDLGMEPRQLLPIVSRRALKALRRSPAASEA